MSLGRILVLNGNSSAGKTSLARALQEALPDRYEIVGLDQWLATVPSELFVIVDHTDGPSVDGFLIPIRDGVLIARPRLGPRALEVVRNMYSTFASLAAEGTNLIVDDVLWLPAALEMAVRTFAGFEAWLIGVVCPTSIAVERERRRDDRITGGAALFGEVVHQRAIYDMTVDTSLLTPEGAAQQIVHQLMAATTPTAFRQLMATLAPSPS